MNISKFKFLSFSYNYARGAISILCCFIGKYGGEEGYIIR